MSINKIEELAVTLKDQPDLLVLLNRFIANYHGLNFLHQLVNLVISQFRPELRLLLHGGYVILSMIDPCMIHYLITSILSNKPGTLTIDQQKLAVNALFSTDLDYLVCCSNSRDVQSFMIQIAQVLNKKTNPKIGLSDQIKLNMLYFTVYYLQKDCQEPLKYYHIDLNDQLYRLMVKCGRSSEHSGSSVHSLLDIYNTHQSDGFKYYSSDHPYDVFIVDLIHLINDILGTGTGTDLTIDRQMQKRIFRYNLFFSLIQHGHLNYNQIDFKASVRSSSTINQLVTLWNGDLRKSVSTSVSSTGTSTTKPSWLIVSSDHDLIWSNELMVIDAALFENAVIMQPNIPIYKPVPNVTEKEELATQKYMDRIPNEKSFAGITMAEVRQIFGHYTANYYQKLNSCLFNFIYAHKCQSEDLDNCFQLYSFIRQFSLSTNDFIYPHLRSTDRITVFRNENNVSLGLIGGYHQACDNDLFITPTFWSTSYSQILDFNKEIILEIDLRPSDIFMIIKSISTSPTEDEILIPFGSIFRVTSKSIVRHPNPLAPTSNKVVLLVKLESHGRLNFNSMQEFYELYHQFNYSHLPNDHLTPIKNDYQLLTCSHLVSLNPNHYKTAYQAYYSRTLPIVFKYRDQEYVLKFYFYRKMIFDVDFEENPKHKHSIPIAYAVDVTSASYLHPLDIELNVYPLTQRIIDIGYVTPHLLRYYPADDGDCSLETVNELIKNKNICRSDASWVCDYVEWNEYLPIVPYRLLEKADTTLEALFVNNQLHDLDMISYTWQLFYTMSILYRAYKMVHFDLRPGNIFALNEPTNFIYQCSSASPSQSYDIMRSQPGELGGHAVLL